jgi:hypothetical protein
LRRGAPHARYFSIVAYNGGENVLPLMIASDTGSANPFRQSIPPHRPAKDGDGDSYTVYVTRGDATPGDANRAH